MAIQDCIKRIGDVTDADVALLEQYIAEGLTDSQAVRRLLIESTANVVDIARQARELGAEVATPKNVMAEITDVTDRKVKNLFAQREELSDQIDRINAEYRDLLTDAELLDQIMGARNPMWQPLENLSESEAVMLLSQSMFQPDVREGFENGVLGIQGTTPREVYASWKQHAAMRKDNRERHIKVVKEYNENRGELELLIRGDRPTGPMEFNQDLVDQMMDEIDHAKPGGELTDISGNVTTNQARIAKIMGAQMYGDMEQMAAVTAKELFQNAFDAARSAVQLGRIEEGRVDITVDTDDRREITVTDNGVGMGPDQIINGLLRIAGTQKEEGTDNSGGYGVAKMLFLFGAESIKVETVRDNIKYTLETTGAEVMANAENPADNPLTIKRTDTYTWHDESGTGTKVTVRIPEEYTDLNTGETKTINAFQGDVLRRMTDRQVLHPDVVVTRQGMKYVHEKSGKHFPYDEYFSLGRVQFEWGTADILVAKEQSFQYPNNTKVLNNGLYQFEIGVTENPLKPFSNLIDRQFIIDLHPATAPEEPSYPITNNRQSLKAHAQQDMIQIQMILAARHAQDKMLELAAGYGSLRTVQVEQGEVILSDQIDIQPEVPEQVRGQGFEVSEKDDVEVRDGKLFVNGKEQEELTKEQFQDVTLDPKTLKVDQSRIRNDIPLIHNNQQFKPADQLEDTDWKDYAGRDLIDVLYEKFGEDRVNQYFHGVGNAFLNLKNLLAIKGDKNLYAGLEKAGVGVSVLGKDYYGVHTRVPGMMMFVNPGADPRSDEALMAPSEEVTPDERARIIATSMMTTMIHEIAHFAEMSHGSAFIFAIQNAFSTAFQETKFIAGVEKELTNAIGDHLDIFQEIAEALEDGAIEVTGTSLTDVGTDLARGTFDAAYVAEQRAEDKRGSRAPTKTGPGTGLAAGKPNADEIQGGAREGGTVVPEGTLSPGAGDGGTLNRLYQGRRGSITFDEMRKATINLFDAADFSTFIHESGHLYLELMGMLAAQPDASEQILADWQTILKYLGVESADQIERKHHELWARTFEKYTMDGQAPSTALQDAFNSFRRWLLEIYKTVLGVRDIEIPDDIRDVMDRMLATEAEISAAERGQEFAALFSSAEQMGVSEEIFEIYKRSLIRAHNDAVEKETTRLLREMKRDEREWWNREKSKVEEEVRAEANEMKEYRAIYMLTRGTQPNGEPTRMAPFKLDRQSLIDRYGKDFIKRLPHRGKYGVYRIEGGVDPDVAAQALGYVDGDALVQAIIRTPAMEDFIAAETEMRMRQRFPDPFKDGSLADNAVTAVHNNRRAEILAAEMRQLRSLMKRDRPVVRATERARARETREAREANRGILPKRAELAVIKQAAAQSIGRRKIRDVRPNVYLNAERKSARLAFEAATKGDFQTAFKHKREQLINHEMYRAAVKAKERSAKTQKYLSKFESPRVQARLGRSGVLDKILSVLEGVDFRKRSLRSIDREKIEQELATAIEEGELVMPPGVLAKVLDDRVNWQELTIDEFEAMRDLIKQLEKQARAEVEAIVNGEKVNMDNAAGEVAEQIYEQNETVDLGVGNKTKWQRTKRSMRQGVAAWLRPSSIARVLDNAGFGAVTRNIIVPMRRAYSERLIPNLHKAQADVSEIYRKHFTNEQLRILNRKRFRVDSQNETYSHSDLLSLALNWGNESSRQAVLGGQKRDGSPAFTEAGVNQMLSNLSENDWAFVQEVWDYLETYWPDLAAAEQRRRGIAPKRVEPVPFTIRTADGNMVTLRGGYYPLKYASEHSDRVKVDEMEDYMKQMGNGVFVTASTRAGATYERVRNHGRVVRLSLNVLDNHLREIVRDIAIGDEVNYLRRMLARKDLRDAFYRTGNEQLLEALNLWLTDAAVGELPAEGIVESTTSWIRTGFTKAKLGWNLMTMLLQFTGFTQSMAVIGSKNMTVGLAKFMRNPKFMWTDVMERSKFLNTRYDIGAWDKDVQDTKAHLESFFGPAPTRLKVSMNFLAHTYFLPIAKAQQVVDITTWLGAYEKGRNELQLSEDDATIFADTQVEAAQTSGFFSDRSGLERGTLGLRKNRQSQFIRIWTTLISYMLAKGNIAYEKTKATKWRKASSVAEWATDMILLFTVEGIASALLYGQMPEDDEAEDYAAWVALRTADSIVSGIPFVREIPSSRFSGGNTPLGSFAKDSYDLWAQIAQGENDEAARKALYNVVGTAFHLPSSQMGRSFEAIWSEDDPEWWEFVTGERSE